MEILPLVLALLFVFVVVRIARLALDPSAREFGQPASSVEAPAGAQRA